MSLIIDAIQKAQQLRSKESKGAPFLTRYGQKRRIVDSSRRLSGLLSLMASGILLILLLSFWGENLLSPFVSSRGPQTLPIPKGTASEPDPLRASLPVLTSKEDVRAQRGEEFSRRPLLVGIEEGYPQKGKGSNWKDEKAPKIITRKGENPLPSPSWPRGEEKAPAFVQPLLHDKREETIPALPGGSREGEPSPSRNPYLLTERPQSRITEATTLFNRAIDFHRKGDLSKAVQTYLKVIEIDPTFIEAYNNLGLLYQEMGLDDKGLEVFHNGLQVNPQYEKILNNVGILLLSKERYEESKEVFQRALTINPNNIESYINLGILLKKEGQMDEAIRNYQMALSLDPLRGETYYNMGLFYEELGQMEKAVDLYRKFIQIAPKAHTDLVSKVKRHLNDLAARREMNR